MKRKVLPSSVLKSEFYRQSICAVPADVFLACITIYQNAARMTMPVVNPQEYKIRFQDQLLAFTDRPENRGMLAVKEFLGEGQCELFPAAATRLLATSGLMKTVRSQGRFRKFFQPNDENGDWRVSEALLKAFASAAFKPGTLDLDLKSLHGEATRLLAKDPD
jgi:hypothetical protein